MSGWLLHDFVATSVLMLVVLAARRPVARLFGAGWAYAMWLAPALRFVLPPLKWPDIPIPAVSIPTAGMTASLPASAGPGQWVPFLLAIWAGGAVIFLILQWLGYRGFARRLAASARPTRPPLYRGIATFVSALVEGPLAIGLIEPRIVVPADFSRRYSAAERRLAMEHEHTHHRHRDIWWNVAATLLLAVNWFNPIAWLAIRAFRTDQELACDAAVAARASSEERHDYARALVKSASRPGLIAACPMNNVGELKRRLRMMGLHRASPARSAGGVAALAAIGLAGAGAGAIHEAPADAPSLVASAFGSATPTLPGPVRLPAELPAPPIVVTGRMGRMHSARRLAARSGSDRARPEAREGTALALAAPAPTNPMPVESGASQPEPAVELAQRPATIFRLADGVLVFRIDGDAPPVLTKARNGPTRITIRLARAVQSTPDGKARLTFQMDEQQEWND